MDKITVKDIDVRYKKIDTGDFICLTDIARYKNPEDPRFIVYSWLRNKNTIVFLGLWEELHNPDFNRIEFDTVKIGIVQLLPKSEKDDRILIPQPAVHDKTRIFGVFIPGNIGKANKVACIDLLVADIYILDRDLIHDAFLLSLQT